MITVFEKRTGLQYYDPQEQAWTPRILDLAPTRAGVTVSEVTALKCLTVFACIRAISEDIAKLPMYLYEKQKPRGQKIVTSRVSDLLLKQPNPEMSAFDFKQTLQAHKLSWGNGMAEIEFDSSGNPKYLWPLPPDRMCVKRAKENDAQFEKDEIYYEFRPNYIDNPIKIPAWKIFHIKGLGFDGLVGYSPIRIAAENIGVSMAQERFAGSFFGNGAYPGSILKHPMKLSPEAAVRLRDSWDNKFRGSENGNRTAILEEGMSVEKMTLAPDEAQFLESRNFSVEDIARLYRIPPHKIGHLARSTNNNVEQQAREYAIDCLHPHAIEWEQEADRKLNVGPRQFYKHDFNEMLRADAAARGVFYTQMRMAGAFTSNDILDLEDMNPNEQGGADTLFIQAAMVPLDMAAKGIIPAQNKPNNDNNVQKNASKMSRIADNHAVLLAEILLWSMKIEAERAQKAAKKPGFEAWKEDFYGSHAANLRGKVRTVTHNLAVCGESEHKADEWTERIVCRHIGDSQAGLTIGTVESSIIGWNESRANREAKEEIEKLIKEISA